MTQNQSIVRNALAAIGCTRAYANVVTGEVSFEGSSEPAVSRQVVVLTDAAGSTFKLRLDEALLDVALDNGGEITIH
jgi:hypothetical protein